MWFDSSLEKDANFHIVSFSEKKYFVKSGQYIICQKKTKKLISRKFYFSSKVHSVEKRKISHFKKNFVNQLFPYFVNKTVDFTKFLSKKCYERIYVIFTHSVEKREISQFKKNFVNLLFSFFACKTVEFMKFLSKKCEKELS